MLYGAKTICVACVFTIFLMWATFQWHSSKWYYPNYPKLHLLQKVRVKLYDRCDCHIDVKGKRWKSRNTFSPWGYFWILGNIWTFFAPYFVKRELKSAHLNHSWGHPSGVHDITKRYPSVRIKLAQSVHTHVHSFQHTRTGCCVSWGWCSKVNTSGWCCCSIIVRGFCAVCLFSFW